LKINILKHYSEYYSAVRFSNSISQKRNVRLFRMEKRKKEKRKAKLYGFSTVSVRVVPQTIGMFCVGDSNTVLAPPSAVGMISGSE